MTAVALVNRSGEVLVQQRPVTAAHGDLWEFPGGKLEPGESAEFAAVRELEEELGVSLAIKDLRPVTFASSPLADPLASRPLIILLYAAFDWTGTPKPIASSQLAWVRPDVLATWPMPPLDYPLAAALARYL